MLRNSRCMPQLVQRPLLWAPATGSMSQWCRQAREPRLDGRVRVSSCIGCFLLACPQITQEGLTFSENGGPVHQSWIWVEVSRRDVLQERGWRFLTIKSWHNARRAAAFLIM